jgi:hypothetical protein
VFLAVALGGCAAVAAILGSQHRWSAAVVAGAATVYFALRLFAGLGRPR